MDRHYRRSTINVGLLYRGKLKAMKAVILYYPKSDHARAVESFARDFTRQAGRRLELVSLESRDGAATAALYDIVQYPAVIAMSNSGEALRIWQGPILPLMNELSYYSADA